MLRLMFATIQSATNFTKRLYSSDVCCFSCLVIFHLTPTKICKPSFQMHFVDVQIQIRALLNKLFSFHSCIWSSPRRKDKFNSSKMCIYLVVAHFQHLFKTVQII